MLSYFHFNKEGSMTDKKIKNISGPRIREIRQSLGLAQQEVAAWLEEFQIKMDASAVTSVEKHNRGISDRELAAFADMFQVSLDWLVGRV